MSPLLFDSHGRCLCEYVYVCASVLCEWAAWCHILGPNAKRSKYFFFQKQLLSLATKKFSTVCSGGTAAVLQRRRCFKLSPLCQRSPWSRVWLVHKRRSNHNKTSHPGQIINYSRSYRSCRSSTVHPVSAAEMFCRIFIYRVQIQPSKHALDHTDLTAPTRYHELWTLQISLEDLDRRGGIR